ncbi:TetR/AcrR family transcriptional regulator [Nocardia stercoris]|uniref:TetR/AcrR family transcriptional regulator n=1 Tax=Nocardia stercoris TaxID=2483361 RepID=UPI001319C56D|nr:TetR/AcrR family transcriptional regulator [Nocardia stercoris]
MVESRRTRKKHELRERILEVAIRQVGERGLAATTVGSIAEEVDISQTTFFNYFPSKAVLVEAVIGRLSDLLGTVLADVGSGDEPAADKVLKLFEFAASLTTTQHRVLRDIVIEVVHESTLSERPSGNLSALHESYRTVLADGQRAGEIRVDLDATILADVVIGMFTSVFTNWADDVAYPISDRLNTFGKLAVELVARGA